MNQGDKISRLEYIRSLGRPCCWLRQAKTAFLLTVVSLSLSVLFTPPVEAQSAQSVASIRVVLDRSVADKPVSGRLLVLFSKKSNPPPMKGPDWFSPEPFVAMNVRDVDPGQVMSVTDTADGFPSKLSTIPPGEYFVPVSYTHLTLPTIYSV